MRRSLLKYKKKTSHRYAYNEQCMSTVEVTKNASLRYTREKTFKTKPMETEYC